MCTETVCILSFRQYSARNLAHRQVIGHYLMGPVENTVIDLFHPGKAAQIQAQENLLLTTTGWITCSVLFTVAFFYSKLLCWNGTEWTVSVNICILKSNVELYQQSRGTDIGLCLLENIMLFFFVVVVSLCCRKRPSTLSLGRTIKGGVEARAKCYFTMPDPTGPINGTEP